MLGGDIEAGFDRTDQSEDAVKDIEITRSQFMLDRVDGSSEQSYVDINAVRPTTQALDKSIASALANNSVDNGEVNPDDVSVEQAITKVPQQTVESMMARNTVRLYTAWLRILYKAED